MADTKNKNDNKEKDIKKKKTATRTNTKKVNKVKKVTKEKEIPEEIMPYIDELSTIEEEKKSEIKEDKDIKIDDNNNWGILGIVVLFIIAIVLLGIYSYVVSVHSFTDKDFKSLGMYTEPVFRDDFIKIRNKTDFSTYFPNINATHFDFENKDYIVISIPYDSCSESNIRPVGYTLDQGIITVRINYERSCGVCAPNYLYYLLELDKNLYYNTINYNYHATNNPDCDPSIAYKPIIYIYPKEKTNVKVTLGNSNLLTSTYPTYNNGWEVVAEKDGTLKDSNREYYALFWEGKNHYAKVESDGFVVKGSDTLEFLEKYLSLLGLNDREANEFIIYWLPQLEVNNYNYIRFETMDEINNYMPLIVEPTPDNIIRVQMDYLPLDSPIEVNEQIINTPTRNGYTVVEWGGSIIKE